MLALLSLLAALAPEPLPPPSPSPPPRAVLVRIDARLTGLEHRLRADAPPSRLRELARALVERARLRLGAGDPAAADQLGAAAFDTLRADRPLLLIVLPAHGSDGPPPPGGFGAAGPRGGEAPLPLGPDGPPLPRVITFRLSPADRAARRLDSTAMMVAMTARFAERGDPATLLGLARTALEGARRALAANDPAGAERGARRAEILARAALHVAIADDPALRPPPFPPVLRRPPPGFPVPPPPGLPGPPPGLPLLPGGELP